MILAAMAILVSAATIISTSGEFTASSSPLYLNWTNAFSGNITLYNNQTYNTTVSITNTTGTLKNLLSYTINFSVNNGTDNDNNFILVANKSYLNITLLANTTGVVAGKYSGNLTIANSTNSSENITTFSVYVDVPITFAATPTGAVGNITGIVTNATNELFFFNRSLASNVAGLRFNIINISSEGLTFGWAGDTACTSYEGTATLNATSNTTTFIQSYFPLANFSCLRVSNTTTTGNITFNGTVELLQASLMVNTTAYPNGTFDQMPYDWTTNITVKENIGFNTTRTIGFTINNTAGYNLTVSNITLNSPSSQVVNVGSSYTLVNTTSNASYVVNLNSVGTVGDVRTANMTISNSSNSSQSNTTTLNESQTAVLWDGTTFGVSYVHIPTVGVGAVAVYLGAPVIGSSNLTNGNRLINYTIGPTNPTVFNGTANSSQINITINTVNTNNTQGSYTGSALITTANGFPYRHFRLDMLVNLTNQLDVNITNITDQTGTTWTVPGNNTNASVSVKYQNGTNVTGLNASNFTVWITHKNMTYFGNTTLANASITNFNVTDAYNIVNATIPSTMLGGLYDYYIYAQDKNTTDKNNATANRTLNVSQTALRLAASCVPLSTTAGTPTYCYVTVANYGSVNAFNVNVTESIVGSCLTLTNEIGYSNTTTVQLGTLTALGGINSTSWKFNTTTGTCSLNITAVASNYSGSTAAKWDTQSLSFAFNITTADTQQSSSDKKFSGNTTTTTNKSLLVTAPLETTVLQGGSATASITIKNTGSSTLSDVRLNVTGVDSSWVSISPTAAVSLPKNQSGSWTVTFSVPANSTIGNYSLSFVGWATGISSSKSSKLVVRPNTATQSDINSSLVSYTDRYENISSLINQTNATGANVTEAAAKLAEAKGLLDSAQEAADSGDWSTANDLLSQIEAALTAAEAALTTSKVESTPINIPWTWVGGGAAVVGVIGLVVYALRTGVKLPSLPSQKAGYYPEIGYRMQQTSGGKKLIDRLKEMFKRKQTVQTYQTSQ